MVMTILSLQRRMSYEEALRQLSARAAGLCRWISGPLHGMAEIYLPYRLYRVTVDDRRLRRVHYYAVDAAAGTLDPYEFTNPPTPDEWIAAETHNFHPARLDEGQTNKLVTEKARRSLYSRGFFRIINPNITAELIQSEFYIPYWAGFYGDEQNISISVLNAIRCTIEGNKVRRLVKTWLLASDSTQLVPKCSEETNPARPR